MGAFVFLLVIIVAVAIMAVGMYNSLVTLRNRCDNGWSQIDVQLRRRYDLIPNLVETAKGGLDSPIGYLAVWRQENGQWRFLAWQACRSSAST